MPILNDNDAMAAERLSAPASPEGIARLTPLDPADTVHADGLVSVRRSKSTRARSSRREQVPVHRDSFDYEISWLDVDGVPYLFDDGVGDEADPVVQGLCDGTVVLYGDTFNVRWLHESEFVEANRVKGDPF